MTALEIIKAATAEGLAVNLSPTGSLKATGDQEAVNRWRSLLKQHKAEIISLLATDKPGGAAKAARTVPEAVEGLPSWCRADCPGLESIPLADEGEVAGCVHPVTGAWRRLDMMTGCAAMQREPRSTLPSWCNTRCEHYHRLDVPDLGTMQWCCHETDATHWRRNRIDSMTGCPHAAKEAGR